MEEGISISQSPLAGFWRRGIAALIDLFLIIIIFLLLGLSYSISASWNYTVGSGLVSTITYLQPLNALLFLIALVIYSTVTEWLWGATLGKFILGVRVVGLQKEKISFGTSLVRNIFTPIDLLVGVVLFLLSKKRQVLGDRIANTIVIRKKLMDLPISDKPISKPGAVFAILWGAMIILFCILTIWTIPKIAGLNEIARNTLESIKEKSSGDTKIPYETFSKEFRESVSLQQFEQAMREPRFSQTLQNLDISEIKFYNWQFNENRAIIVGRESDTLVQVKFVKNDAGEWKLLAFNVQPGVKDVSLWDLFRSN